MQLMHSKVRPRWVWSGVVLMVAAMVVIGVANIAASTLWEIIGIVLLLAGGGVSLSGRVMRDVHGARVETIHDPLVVTGVDTRPRPSMVPSRAEVGSAAWVGLVVVAAWLVVSRTILGVPFESQTSGATLREFSVAIVVVMAAALLHQHGAQDGRSRIAMTVCAACGVLLVVSSLVVSFGDHAQMISELVSGVALLVLVAATALRPEPSPPRTPSGPAARG